MCVCRRVSKRERERGRCLGIILLCISSVFDSVHSDTWDSTSARRRSVTIHELIPSRKLQRTNLTLKSRRIDKTSSASCTFPYKARTIYSVTCTIPSSQSPCIFLPVSSLFSLPSYNAASSPNVASRNIHHKTQTTTHSSLLQSLQHKSLKLPQL